jgi:hypothetical protein
MGCQLTLFGPRGTDYASPITTAPPPPHIFGRRGVSDWEKILTKNQFQKKISFLGLSLTFKQSSKSEHYFRIQSVLKIEIIKNVNDKKISLTAFII